VTRQKASYNMQSRVPTLRFEDENDDEDERKHALSSDS
jgi:hypothetical protein